MNGVYWYGEIAGTSRCDLEYCFSLWTKKLFELLLKTPVYSVYTLKILRQPGGWGLSATGSRSQAWLDLTDAAHMEAHIKLRAWLVCMIDALSLKGAKFELCSHWEATLPRPRTFKRRILKCQVLCGSTVPIGSLWCRPQHWRRLWSWWLYMEHSHLVPLSIQKHWLQRLLLCHLGCRFWPLCRSPQSTTKEIIAKTSFEVENSYLKPQLFRKTDFTCYYSPSFLLHQWFVPMPFPRRLSLNCIPGAIQKLEGKLGLIFEN